MPRSTGQRGAPQFVRYFGPVIAALQQLGGSGRPEEVRARIVQALGLSEKEQTEPLPSGIPRFENQVHWARFYLAKAGYLGSSRHGVWSLTDKSRDIESLTFDQSRDVFRSVASQFGKARRAKTAQSTGVDESVTPEQVEAAGLDYVQEIAAKLLALPPSGFERFCQRLLRESGFQQVTVTGQSGDGGIDGIGILQVNALVSFKVLFQCKRYKGAVGSGGSGLFWAGARCPWRDDGTGRQGNHPHDGVIYSRCSEGSGQRRSASDRVGGRREASRDASAA